jgi:hypothetical protein
MLGVSPMELPHGFPGDSTHAVRRCAMRVRLETNGDGSIEIADRAGMVVHALN